MRKVMVIAEAACTWVYPDLLVNASISIAHAAWAGADVWKTQWTSDPVAMAARRGVTADYSRLAWSAGLHETLAKYCEDAGLKYMCTVFLPKDVATVAKYARVGKVAYSERNDTDLIEECKARFERVIVSGVDLHCVPEYPTALEKLRVDRVHGKMGLSDHSKSRLSGAVAVGCGATIIEKHFRMEDTPKEDADYPHSLRPTELREYMRYIREASRMLD